VYGFETPLRQRHIPERYFRHYQIAARPVFRHGKVHLVTGREGTEGGSRYSCSHCLTSAHDEGWSTPRCGRFTPGKDTLPIVQEAGRAPVPVWTGAENLILTGFRSPDRLVRSESPYRLSHPGTRFPVRLAVYADILIIS